MRFIQPLSYGLAFLGVLAVAWFLDDLSYFWDLTSAGLVLVSVGGLLLYSHGKSAFGLIPGVSGGDLGHAGLAAVAQSGSGFAVTTGAVGTVIGCIQMLQGLEDPSAINPALAVALLTLLYGLLLAALVFEPLAHFHRSQASQAEPAADGGHGLLLSVLSLTALSVGGSFMALFSAFEGYTR